MTDLDLFGGVGQSNLCGRGDAALSPATNALLAYEWRSALIALADPVASGLLYGANTGSLWPSFVNEFTIYSERPAVVIPAAVGGTMLLPASTTGDGHWGPGGTRFSTAVTRIQNAINGLVALGHTPHLKLAWSLGESDAASYPVLADLEDAMYDGLIDLIERFRTALSLPDLKMYIWRTGTRPGYEAGCAAVRAAQDRACADHDGLVMAYTRSIDFPDLGWMKADQLHYTQAGLNDCGTLGARAVATDLGYDVPIPPAPTGLAHRINAADLISLLG